MKKYFLIVILFFLWFPGSAQLIKKGNVCIGINEFVLGAPATNYIVHELNGGRYQKDGREYRICSPGVTSKILDTSFNSTLIILNDSNKLVNVTFIKFYLGESASKKIKKTKKFYKQLATYIAGELYREGASKIYYQSKITDSRGLEWTTATTLLKLMITTGKYSSSLELSFGEPGTQ